MRWCRSRQISRLVIRTRLDQNSTCSQICPNGETHSVVCANHPSKSYELRLEKQFMSLLYDKFKSLIENGTKEVPLQAFLEANPRIIQQAVQGGSYFPTVFPKFSLGGEFIPDFAVIGHRSSWMWTVDLIEIEPSVLERPLFNKADQPAGRLRDAEIQVSKWQAWMEKNRHTVFVPKALDMLKKRRAWDARPEFYELSEGTHQTMNVWYRIIVGRREHFEGWGNKYRHQKYTQHVEIVPWDRLLERLEESEALAAKSIEEAYTPLHTRRGQCPASSERQDDDSSVSTHHDVPF